jgi:hypothetical protein
MDDTPNPDQLERAQRTPAEEHAWWIHLDAWVTRLRRGHEHLWPPIATSVAHREHGRLRQRPWPECWRSHPGLVEFLNALRVWQTELVALPLTDATARAFVDWYTVVEQMLAQDVQAIAKYCANGHRDPDVGPPKSRSHLVGKAHGPWSDAPVGSTQHDPAGRNEQQTPQQDGRGTSGGTPSSEGLT